MRFLAMSVIAAALLSPRVALAGCTVIEFFDCPPISAYTCAQLFYSCEGPAPNKKCISPEVDDFGGNLYNGTRQAGPGEAGFQNVVTLGTVNCYQERDCDEFCDQVPIFGWWRCKQSNPNAPWTPAGDTYYALDGNTPCEGEYGYP